MSQAARTRVELCGQIAVLIGGRQLESALAGRQLRLLFAFLVLHRGRPVRRDELIAALWPETPPPSSQSVLNALVSRLRKALGAGVICGRSELTIELGQDAWIDVEVAVAEIQRAERALESGEWQQAQRAAECSLSIAERGFLAGIEDRWVELERGRLEELRLAALECLCACGLALGGSQLPATERAAQALIAAAPYRETGYRYLMQALARRGRVAEALTVFDGFRRLLQEELGLPPGAELRSLNERLLSEQGQALRSQPEESPGVGPRMDMVLFSDMVDIVGDDRAAQLRQTHERLFGTAVAAHGGRVEVTDGGLVAVFDSAQRALDCAVELQRAVARHNVKHPQCRLGVRVALHRENRVGIDEQRPSACVVDARRLCEGAAAGQILASGAMRPFMPPQHGARQIRLSPIGDEATGVAVVEVLWEPAPPQPFALPAVFSADPRDLFVGREPDLARLWHRYEQASLGTRHIVMLRGEPGIGKTRLACELGGRAQADGAVVLYGRCDEEPLLPHQPFVEALRHYVHACPLPELAGHVTTNSGELRRLVPELTERLPDLGLPLTGDPEGERYRLFEAVGALLCEVAQDRPVVLVLDDLHWADTPSLLLLRHLARFPRQAALLVVGTYRDSELDPAHPLSATLADLSRENSFERQPLGFLDQIAVGRLVSAHAGHDVPELAEMIFEETAGNPFFAVEMLRHLTETGGDQGEHWQWVSDLRAGGVGIPDGVKDVIARRIARLGHTTRRVLEIASVSGRDFELVVLERMSDFDEDQLVEALERAVHAHVIEEVAGAVGRYTFSHALIRDTIYGELSAARRALLHRRVAASLEESHADDLDSYRAELAHHFSLAGSAGDLDKAIEYGARAGDRALAQLAYEQAATHYRHAVSLTESVELPRRRIQRCDLLIAQGEAERRAGDPAYRETLLEVARLAQQLGDAERLARAVLANNRGFFSASTGVDRERVAMLQAALRAQTGDSPIHASLLAQLSVELVADPDWSRRARLSDDALAMARRVGDPATLVRTLNYRYAALWGPGTLQVRLAGCREASELADRVEDPVLAFHAAHFEAHAQLEAGDLALADHRLQRAGELAEQIAQPIIHWYFAVGRAKRRSISDSPDEAEKLTRAAFDVGRSAGQVDAFAWFLGQLHVIRFLQGTLASGQPNFLTVAEAPVEFEGPQGSRAVPLLLEGACLITLCEVGRPQDAHERFGEWIEEVLDDLPHDWATLAIRAMAAIVCAHLGDRPRAEALYALLAPHAGQFVDNGPSWFGATGHYMALLAATLGRIDDADGCYATAADAYEQLGAEPWLARLRLDWAQMLLTRRSDGDAQHAEEILRQALAAAQKLGLARVQRQAASLLQSLGRETRQPQTR